MPYVFEMRNDAEQVIFDMTRNGGNILRPVAVMITKRHHVHDRMPRRLQRIEESLRMRNAGDGENGLRRRMPVRGCRVPRAECRHWFAQRAQRAA